MMMPGTQDDNKLVELEPEPEDKLVELEDEEDEPELTAPSDAVDPDIKEQVKKIFKEDDAAKEKQVSIQTEQVAAMMKAFKEQFAGLDWYEKHPPKIEANGSITMQFKTQEDMAQFSLKQAEAGQNFVLVDGKTNKVLAYSNGDGKLHNADDSVYKPDQQKGAFTPGGDIKDFKMPRTGPKAEQKEVEVEEKETVQPK